ncbi:hypothetical protein MMC14_006578 [Varicellaria rhodocarpa]|nr:hypothetical protein [Varicellaria rhodocarpa]
MAPSTKTPTILILILILIPTLLISFAIGLVPRVNHRRGIFSPPNPQNTKPSDPIPPFLPPIPAADPAPILPNIFPGTLPTTFPLPLPLRPTTTTTTTLPSLPTTPAPPPTQQIFTLAHACISGVKQYYLIDLDEARAAMIVQGHLDGLTVYQIGDRLREGGFETEQSNPWGLRWGWHYFFSWECLGWAGFGDM